MEDRASERATAAADAPLVLFLFGLRVNRYRDVWRWVPAWRRFNRLIKQLRAAPEKGLLGIELWRRRREVLAVQYWRSFEALDHYARHPSEPHVHAWKRFNERYGRSGAVGLWHEAYLVEAGQYESVYLNLPPFGLGRATGSVPAQGHRQTARLRLERND